MDELSSAPLNKAHSLARKAASLAELGNFAIAIELYKQANDKLAVILDTVAQEPILRKSIELQWIENDWQIHVLTLRSKASDEDPSLSPQRSPARKTSLEDREDDEIVVVDHFDHFSSNFMTDSLNPNRTIIMRQLGRQLEPTGIRQRSASTSAVRNPLKPTSDNNNTIRFGKIAPFVGKKLPKTDAQREEEILEEVKLKQKLAREFFAK